MSLKKYYCPYKVLLMLHKSALSARHELSCLPHASSTPMGHL